ncbi:MAG: hypothetical protein Q8L37_05075 [Candidatus Gottesmanbacteria bacterium]|nr:hypothetical protein [Candidatus Gottesmanbacteria bacterium]
MGISEWRDSSGNISEWDLTADDYEWITETLTEAAAGVGNKCPKVVKIVLFGSVARGEAKYSIFQYECSDTDIGFVTDDPGEFTDAIFEIMRRARYKKGQHAQFLPCEFHFIRPEVYKDPDGVGDISPEYRIFMQNVKRDAVVLYEKF